MDELPTPPTQDQSIVDVAISGYELLADPVLNKGTAFTEAERGTFGLHGLLPPRVATLDDQVSRRSRAFDQIGDDLDKHIFLRELQDINETLFYALLVQRIGDMLPIVYTPTVGAGCQHFSRIYRKPRGLFLSPPYQDKLDRIFSNPRFDRIECICVTDGERILGLGDQGAGGMGIPIGKLALYSACGGLHPSTTLPIMLDVGTDNQERLDDPIYIGWNHARVRGEEYDAFIERFISAVNRRWPHVLLQWEDFGKSNASRLLDRYRDRLCTFNDDIQGTAAVVAGALFAAMRVSGQRLAEERVVLLGVGSAGIGIAELLLAAMEEAGVDRREALRRFFPIGRRGLMIKGEVEADSHQEPFLPSREDVSGWDLENPGRITLLDVVRNAKPTILIGTSGQPGAFPEEVVREMAKHVERPVIFPLSNPTRNSEAAPQDLLDWTEGRAVIGTGSPFPPATRGGRTSKIDQINNVYIFPGLGIGVIASDARRITNGMFMAAAKALADASPAREDPKGTLLPPITALRDVAFRVACAVARRAIEENLSSLDPHKVEEAVRRKVWEPNYRTYRAKPSSR